MTIVREKDGARDQIEERKRKEPFLATERHYWVVQIWVFWRKLSRLGAPVLLFCRGFSMVSRRMDPLN